MSFDPLDVERAQVIMRAAKSGAVAPKQKAELRAILAKYSDRAHDLDWESIMDVADYFLRIAARDAAEGVAA